jgi:hypothetical protein
MIERIPQRLRVAFTRADASAKKRQTPVTDDDGRGEVDFVAYAEDCLLFGRTILGAGRLSDMLNDHDEYVLAGVTVERFDGGEPMTVDEVVVGREEILLVHASGPRGDVDRRHRTSQHHMAMQLGQYQVRGFYHALPGSDPRAAIRRRRIMVPLTNVRIEYLIGGEARNVRVDTVILNRDHIDWLEAVEPDRSEFPAGPQQTTPDPT